MSACVVSMNPYSPLSAAEEFELTVSASGEAARSQDHVVLAEHHVAESSLSRNHMKPMVEGLHANWKTSREDVGVLTIGVI